MTSNYTTLTISVIPAGNVESSDQGWEVHNIDIPSTYLPWILDLGIPCQDDEHQNKNQKPPSFQQGALESSDQGWEVHNIYIPSTYLPWILDLGNPAKMTSNYTTTITPVIPAGIAGIQ